MDVPKIFVAIDHSNPNVASYLINQLKPELCGIKIGKELFTSAGPKFVQKVVDLGFMVFLDLKFHDIPNTVAQACFTAAKLGVFMLNVHIAGGSAMIEAARDKLDTLTRPPKLIGVTVLTSLNDQDLTNLGFHLTTQALVEKWTNLGQQAGLDGIVCSAMEVKHLREKFQHPFLFITPGIRPQAKTHDDQKRVMTPVAAIEAGSDYLVIGRPITQAKDPMAVLESIQNDLSISI